MGCVLIKSALKYRSLLSLRLDDRPFEISTEGRRWGQSSPEAIVEVVCDIVKQLDQIYNQGIASIV